MAVNSDLGVEDIGIPDDARAFVTFEVFAQHYAQTMCAHLAACGVLDAAQMSACLERNLRTTGWDQDVEIMKGRLEINELQCLDAIKSSRCDNSDNDAVVLRCRQFLYQPHQGDGAACLSSVECTNGEYCRQGGSDAGATEQVTGCPGVCSPPKAAGAACRINEQCGTNAYCRPATHVCVTRAALGEACFAAFANAPDGTKPFCQVGLNCPTFPTGGPSLCETPVMQTALDGACDPYQGTATNEPACADGMYCQVQYNASNVAVGGACKMKIGAGDDCNMAYEGIFGVAGLVADNQCPDGSYCYQLPAQAKATCQPLGSASSDCKSFTGTVSSCKEGLICDATNTCVPFGKDGDTCNAASHCASFSSFENVCIAANADAGAYLTCQAMKNFGASCIPGIEDSLCTSSDILGSSSCAPTSGGQGVCAPKCF